MANQFSSRRGTPWRKHIDPPAFRLGFDHVRQGLGFDPSYDQRSQEWQYNYEVGRLFAASPYSKRWATSDAFKHPTRTAIEAFKSARRYGDIPRAIRS